jgi:hypothetical protein
MEKVEYVVTLTITLIEPITHGELTTLLENRTDVADGLPMISVRVDSIAEGRRVIPSKNKD